MVAIKPKAIQTEKIVKEIGFWTLSIVWIFNRLNTQYTTFRRLDLSPSSGKKEKRKKMVRKPILLGPLERANLNHWSRSSLRNVVYFVFSLLKIRTMDKVQKPISLIQQPSSEPFRIY
jgi:hypothetical protein